MKDKLLSIVAILAVSVWGFSYYQSSQPIATPLFGATNTKFAQLQPYALYGGGAVAGATTITLKSMKDIDGNTLTMAAVFGSKGYGTLEPGKGTQEESISFTGLTNNTNGTVTLTGIKSCGFTYPYTETSGLLKTHPGSATFVISNTACFYNQFVAKDSDGNISQTLTFASTAQPQYDIQPGTWTSGLSLIDKNYADSLAINGAGTSTETALGLVVITPASVVGSSTASTSPGVFGGAPYVIENKFATSSPGTLCAAGKWGCIPVALGGKILQTFLKLSDEFDFTGGVLSTASTTINTATTTITGNTSIATSTPYFGFSLNVGGMSSFTGGVAFGVGSSTMSNGTIVSRTASTTDLTVSGKCTNCADNGYVRLTTSVVNPNSGTVSGDVVCPNGKTAISGGVLIGGTCGGTGVSAIFGSYPSATSTWTGLISCGNSASGNSTVYAICVNP